MGPWYPYPIPPQFFPTPPPPLPRRGLSPGTLVTSVAPCILRCVRVGQDGGGDGVRKEVWHVMIF